jgi:hypothetical protein
MPLKITDRHRRAAKLLGKGHTHADTASIIGVSRTAIYTWTKRPEFMELVDRARIKSASVVHLVTEAADEELPADWRQRASETLATAAIPAVGIIMAAMRGADVTRHQLDTARWLIERLAIEAPAAVAPDEITTSDDLVAALVESVDVRVLEAALERAAG